MSTQMERDLIEPAARELLVVVLSGRKLSGDDAWKILDGWDARCRLMLELHTERDRYRDALRTIRETNSGDRDRDLFKVVKIAREVLAT